MKQIVEFVRNFSERKRPEVMLSAVLRIQAQFRHQELDEE